MPASESQPLTDKQMQHHFLPVTFVICGDDNQIQIQELLFLNETSKMQPNVIDGSIKVAVSTG